MMTTIREPMQDSSPEHYCLPPADTSEDEQLTLVSSKLDDMADLFFGFGRLASSIRGLEECAYLLLKLIDKDGRSVAVQSCCVNDFWQAKLRIPAGCEVQWVASAKAAFLVFNNIVDTRCYQITKYQRGTVMSCAITTTLDVTIRCSQAKEQEGEALSRESLDGGHISEPGFDLFV